MEASEKPNTAGHRRKIASEAEDTAAAYLVRKGYTILSRNYRADRCEIDIIARKKNALVFIEVKSSRSSIPPELEIDARKIAHLARAAEVFIAESDLKYLECRFDALLLRKKGNYWEINHLEDAFRPEPPP